MASPTSSSLELRDIHLPEPISWWPPAPGWWLLLGLVVLVIATVFLLRLYRKKQVLKKQVMAEFKAICANYQTEKNTLALVRALSILLRRACISFYPRSEAAGLTGAAWLEFLDRTGPEKKFSTEPGCLLATAPYLAETTTLDIDAEQLMQLCAHWLKAQPHKNHASINYSRAGAKS
ncbi:MAG: DUF4381 domain-containing protein [Gammaproteobacteria bacterium]|jgi:hypothetical protein|nr:DUF4381 domain-containing protein [Gammaproteobacteria bacterium]